MHNVNKNSIKNRHKRYFDLAFQYNVAAASLWISINEAPYLFNPCMFLARHTVELLLKGLIYRDCDNAAIITIAVGKTNKALDSIHDLLLLWQCYLDKKQPSLFPTDEVSERICKAIRQVNKIDADSTKYRYPERKRPVSVLNMEPIRLSKESDAISELTNSVPVLLITHNKAAVLKSGKTSLKRGLNIFDLIEDLFQIAEPC